MSLEIVEVLRNAEYNLKNPINQMQREMGFNQLNNATTLLEKGYCPFDDINPILEKYVNVDNAPDKI